MIQTPIKDCFWDVKIKQCGTLTKWFWQITTNEPTRANDVTSSVEFSSMGDAMRNWEIHAKAVGIKKWKYVK